MATLSTTASNAPAKRPRGSAVRRATVFAVGSVLHLLAAAAWLLSVLLTAPLMVAGLWVWSREFEWAERWLGRCVRWARSLWERVKAHPVKWGAMTIAGVGVTATAYWLLMA